MTGTTQAGCKGEGELAQKSMIKKKKHMAEKGRFGKTGSRECRTVGWGGGQDGFIQRPVYTVWSGRSCRKGTDGTKLKTRAVKAGGNVKHRESK